MNGHTSNGSKESHDRAMVVKEFLLAEFKYLGDCFWRNEETGEKRVKFFITLVTAVLGALATLAAKNGVGSRSVFFPIAIYALSALVAVGVTTLFRMIKRNRVTDGYKHDMDDIRRRFQENFDDQGVLEGYHPFGGKQGERHALRKFGGLAHTVAVINSFILGTLTGVIAYGIRSFDFFVAVSTTFAIALFLQLRFIINAEEHAKATLRLQTDMMKANKGTMETETTLLICSNKPSEFIKSFGMLREIPPYRLKPGPPLKIHDIYFDTAKRDLEHNRFALRWRRINDDSLITLKGPSSSDISGVPSRMEIELPWSAESLHRISKECRELGDRLSTAWPKNGAANPIRVMEEAGLIVIQDRKTDRIIRNVERKSEGQWRFFAEMAIDSVVYRLPLREVCHHEIEIEVKSGGDTVYVQDCSERLLSKYQSKLKKWEHGKLAVGIAIRMLDEQNQLPGLLDENNNLLPAAYDKIENLLQK